jgi:hypothetical protein
MFSSNITFSSAAKKPGPSSLATNSADVDGEAQNQKFDRGSYNQFLFTWKVFKFGNCK